MLYVRLKTSQFFFPEDKMLRARLLVSMLLAGAALTACIDEPEPTAPGVNANKVPSPASGRHPGEAAFEEVSQVAPSFAGFFFEGDRLVILVTDTKGQSAAEAAVRQTLAQHIPIQAEPRIASRAIVQSARYSFTQLREWRDQIEDEFFFSLPDAAWIDLDEAHNQIAIGLVDGSGRSEVERQLSRLAVPAAAVRIEITGRDEPNLPLTDDVRPVVGSSAIADQWLTSRVRPVVGGLVNSVKSGNVIHDPWCTYGFNARHQGTNVILTSSHCTRTMYGKDNPTSVWYQNKVRSNDSIGTEWKDPPAFSGNRRYSDAAMIKYAPGVNFKLGYIARTTSRSQTWGVNGSRLIDAANPTFRITNLLTYPVQGQMVEKMGKATGWTAGQIFNTCVNVIATDGFWRNCTYRARYYSDSRDSGSPIFIRPGGAGNDITLIGIHWGYNPNLEDSSFSPLGGVFEDFGTMTVMPPPPTPLSVSIEGPRTVGPGDTCTWRAVGSGGAGGYSYQWSGGLVSGSGSQKTATVNQSSGIVVTVTDADNMTNSTSIGVIVNPTAPYCGGV